MDILEEKIKIHMSIFNYLGIGIYDDYIEHIIHVNSGIPSNFLMRLEKTTKVEYNTSVMKIHTYYIFGESPNFITRLFFGINNYELVQWNCPPNGFDNFYSIIMDGNIEIYTFGIYNDYIFPGQKVCFLSFNEFGFKIDDFISNIN